MTLRIGIAGLVHDHVWGLLPQWDSVADAELVAIAEPNRKLWSKVVLQGPQPRFFPSWRDMLREARLDIIQITTENDAALPIVEAAAELGVAIMLEKPLAASLQDGERIFRAARAASVPFLVNWFTMWDPAIQTTLNIARRGDIGRPNYFRFRIGHAGPREIGCTPEFYSWLYDRKRNGGGALVDFCGYGAYMAAWLLGEPRSVTGIAGRWVKRDIDVEDNGVICLQYDSAVALCEGSWTQASQTQIDGPIIHGEAGSVMLANGVIQLIRSAKQEPEVILPEPPPLEMRSGPAYFTNQVKIGARPDGLFDPWNALVSQRSVAAGLKSVESGCGEPLSAVPEP